MSSRKSGGERAVIPTLRTNLTRRVVAKLLDGGGFSTALTAFPIGDPTTFQKTFPMRFSCAEIFIVLGPLPNPAPGMINTLANAWLEWDAGQNVLGLRQPWFIGIPEAEYMRDTHRAANALMPEKLRAAHEAGQFFLTLEIAAKMNLPAQDEMASQMTNRLPSVLSLDQVADWHQWPMRVKPFPSADKTGLETKEPRGQSLLLTN